MDLREQPNGGFTRHPWELARYQFFAGVLQDHGLPTRCERLLDAGAGDGWFASQLMALLGPEAEIVCFDPGYDAETARSGRLLFTRGKPDGRFDLILLLDVLEHVADDRSLVGAMVAENLEVGGFALVSVPSSPTLYSDHDVALGHHRRYAPSRCRAMLVDAGLSVVESGGLFHSLVAPRLLQKAAGAMRRRRIDKALEPRLEWRGGELSRRLVLEVLEWDIRLSRTLAKRKIPLPGLSWWALCQKA